MKIRRGETAAALTQPAADGPTSAGAPGGAAAWPATAVSPERVPPKETTTMANRRQVKRTQTIQTEHRVEFSADELRKRLRLPEGAKLSLSVDGGNGADYDATIDDQPLLATWTTTATKEG
jgi:hypothetical protein